MPVFVKAGCTPVAGRLCSKDRAQDRAGYELWEVALLNPLPLDAMLNRHRLLLLDGGLATALEARGHNLNHPLWSARLLLKEPDAIRKVHRAYLDAGSMCITTASYQASVEGLMAAGSSKTDAAVMLMDCVAIAASRGGVCRSDRQEKRS